MDFSGWEIVEYDNEEMRLRFKGAGCANGFYVLGAGTLLMSMVGYLRHSDPMAMVTTKLLGGIGIIIIIAGIMSSFSKGTAIIYRNDGMIQLYKKVFFIPVKKEYQIGEVVGIRYATELRDSSDKPGASKTQWWMIYFKSRAGVLTRYCDYISEKYARDDAEKLADFFKVPLDDGTGKSGAMAAIRGGDAFGLRRADKPTTGRPNWVETWLVMIGMISAVPDKS
jgi:hypothetical protein